MLCNYIIFLYFIFLYFIFFILYFYILCYQYHIFYIYVEHKESRYLLCGDFKLTNGMLSYILIPLAFIIIYNEKYVKHFSYSFICIALIGSNDTVLALLKYRYYLLFITVILLHLLLLYPLLNIKRYLKSDLSNLILGFIGILIVKFLPYWPYILTRQEIINHTIIIYALIGILYSIEVVFYKKN